MAAKIVIGLSTYLVDFAGGQAGLRTPPYIQYATDHDTNYQTLRTTINQLIDEVNAVQGPNASLGVDLVVFDRDGRAGGSLLSGLVGVESFATTINAGDVEVGPGTVIVDGTKISNDVGGTFDAAALPDGTAFVAIDLNGALSLEDDPAQQALDLYQVTVTGGVASSPVRLADVFFDGDEYERMRDRPSAANSWSAKDYDQFYKRIAAVERFLAGLTTDDDGDALPSRLLLRDGSAATPGIGFVSGVNTGFFRQGSGVIGVTVVGTEVMRFRSSGLRVVPLGSAGTPAISRTGDTDTGIFFVNPNVLGFATTGVERARLDAEGNLDLPTNSRVKGVRTAALSVSDASATLVSFTASDDFDIGAWHDHTAGSPGDQEFTVPAGGDGLYQIVLDFEWADPVNLTTFLLEITVNGTPLPEKVEHDSDVNFAGQLTALVNLTAADVVRARVTQNDTVAANALDLEHASLAIVKIA